MIEINEVENVVRESFKRAKERLELVKEAYEFIEKKPFQIEFLDIKLNYLILVILNKINFLYYL